jgi:hypothetical protein
MPTTPSHVDQVVPALAQPFAPSTAAPETADSVEALLSGWIAAMSLDPPPHARGRPRILPSLCLWAGMLVCVTRGWSSQLSLWRLLSSQGFWFFPPLPISDQAVYRRLAREGTAPLEQLFTQISALIAARLEALIPSAFRELAAFAQDIVVLDEMTLDRVLRTLAGLRARPAGAAELLGGKRAGVFDVRRQQWRRVQLRTAVHQNEQIAARAGRRVGPGHAGAGRPGLLWFRLVR